MKNFAKSVLSVILKERFDSKKGKRFKKLSNGSVQSNMRALHPCSLFIMLTEMNCFRLK